MHLPPDNPQVSLGDLPKWLVADLRALQPCVAGPSYFTPVVVTAFRAAGVTTRVGTDECARVSVRVNEIPVTALGSMDEEAIKREIDLTTDYVVAFPAADVHARKVPLAVHDEALLVATITGDRPCLVYARNSSAARSTAGIGGSALLARVAMSELRAHRAEARKEQALSAAADAWSGLQEASQTALRLQMDLQRIEKGVRQRDLRVREFANVVALAERLLEEHRESYVCLVRALGLFRKKRLTSHHQFRSLGALHNSDPLIDIISVLRKARTDLAVTQDVANED